MTNSAKYFFIWCVLIIPAVGFGQSKTDCQEGEQLVEASERVLEEDYHAALNIYDELLRVTIDTACLAYLYQSLGKTHTRLSSFGLAVNNYQKALQLTPLETNPKERAEILSGLAFTYNKSGEYEKAYNLELEALKIGEFLQKESLISRSLYQLGSLAYSRKKFNDALKHYFEADKILEAKSSDPRKISISGAIGSTYMELGELDKAVEYLKKSVSLAEELDRETDLAYAFGNLAITYSKMGNFELAIRYFYDSINRKSILGDKEGVIGGKLDLGLLWIKLKRYNDAENILNDAMRLAIIIDAKGKLLDCYEALNQLFREKEQYAEAHYYLEKYAILKDEILSEKSQLAIETQQTIYESEKKEAEIQRLNDIQAQRDITDRLKRNIAIATFAFLFLLFLFGVNVNRKLRRQNEELELFSKKLESKNEELKNFTSIASHDLKQPLRTVNSFISLIERRYIAQLDDTAKEYMDFIHKGIDRMQNLLEDLLNYSRVDKTDAPKEKVNSLELVQTAIEQLDSEINQKKAKIIFRKEEFPDLEVIPSQVIQLFQNLIANAVKFTNGHDPIVTLNWENKGSTYLFSVKDNGIGIEPEYAKKIFEMFSRLHSQQEFEGTGIGLATCQKIVEHYGGRIWVESKKGEGAKFYFTIPKPE